MSGRVFIIAEVGPNHNGSRETAFAYVDALARFDIDAVKFQLACPELVYSADAFKAGYQIKNDGEGSVVEMSRRVQLKAEDHVELYKACRRAGVHYMCTAFDLESLRFLDQNVDIPYFKVASGEILTLDMLEYMADRERPIILSTGMADYAEIESAIGILCRKGPRDITLLHCVSNYPAPLEDINLLSLTSLRSRFDLPVGYSDHSLGSECCLGAVALGAVVIEKHVTFDRNLPGPDHKASATIEEFGQLVASIRRLEKALGKAEKVISGAEFEIRKMARKSIVAKRDLVVGTRIQPDDITFKRPGTGLSPLLRDRLIGRRVKKHLAADRVIHAENLDADSDDPNG
jgi:N,N'-diacetyllegionaminate synthase